MTQPLEYGRMREELLETEAIELPGDDGEEPIEPPRGRCPATIDERPSSRSGEARSARRRSPPPAASSPAPRRSPSSAPPARLGSRRPAKRSRAKERPVKVVASRSFLVDVHLLGD